MALTTLENVKSWLIPASTPSSSNDDLLLTRLINQVGGATLNYLERPSITRNTFTELRSGVNNQRLVLRNWPVISIISLTVNGNAIPSAATPTSPGYTLAIWDGTSPGIPQEITLSGYRFSRGLNNIQIVYTAGYCIQNEAWTVPASSPYQITPQQLYGPWAQDDGVTYATGIALTKVSGTPAQGQYSVGYGSINPVSGQSSVYTFSTADTGQSILLNYSYTPSALEQAVIEWIGERYRYKDRIGQKSKSLGGTETAAYSLQAMPDFVSCVFDGFRKFLPL